MHLTDSEMLIQKFTFEGLAKSTDDGNILFHVPRNFHIDVGRQPILNPDAPWFATNLLSRLFEQRFGKHAYPSNCKYI